MSQINAIPMHASASYTWKLLVYEQDEKLCVNWESDAPFTPEQINIAIYNDPLSEPYPRGADWALWIKDRPSGRWETGLKWASGYYVTINAITDSLQKPTDYPWRYIVKAGPTKS